MTKWANEKLKYHRWEYGEFYDYATVVNQGDDRRLYINIYNQIAEAIEAVGAVENSLVHVALNREIREAQNMLKDIRRRFWDKFQANIA